MVIDHAYPLHKRIDNRRAHKPKPPLFQIFR